MKNLRSARIFTTITLIFIFLFGCRISEKTPSSTNGFAIATSTYIPTSLAMSTVSVSKTPSPSPTPTPYPLTSTTTATTTSTSMPTLTTGERLGFTQELFQTNANCAFPCWWGITPGKTTWPEVEAFLQYIGARTTPNFLNNGWIYHSAGGFDLEFLESIVTNRMGFLEKDEIVELIFIRSEGYSYPMAFQEQWAAYSPDRLLGEYGVPTRIWLESKSSGPVAEGRIAGYTLWIFYDQLDLLILYNGYGKYEPIYHFCPRFDNGEDIRYLEMYLQSPDNPNPIEETAGVVGLEIDSYPNIQSIEEATGLSTIEFFNLFIQENKQACFDTSRDIWP